MSSKFSDLVCILRGEGLNINFSVAHVVHMTCVITNDFPHHPDTRMSQPIMLDLECINILENHFIHNMWNMFYVHVVQSRR
jgi:hypothetical protein